MQLNRLTEVDLCAVVVSGLFAVELQRRYEWAEEQLGPI